MDRKKDYRKVKLFGICLKCEINGLGIATVLPSKYCLILGKSISTSGRHMSNRHYSTGFTINELMHKAISGNNYYTKILLYNKFIVDVLLAMVLVLCLENVET